MCLIDFYVSSLGQYDHNLCSASDSSCVACQVRLPDCTGLPDGENAVTGMLWSVNYIVCQSNRTTDVKQCRRGVFDPNVRKCSETVGPRKMVCLLEDKIVHKPELKVFANNKQL